MKISVSPDPEGLHQIDVLERLWVISLLCGSESENWRKYGNAVKVNPRQIIMIENFRTFLVGINDLPEQLFSLTYPPSSFI